MSPKVCNYPDCVDREPDGKCVSWITAACPGPDENGNIPCEDCSGCGQVGEPNGGSEFQPPEFDPCESCQGSGVWHVKSPVAQPVQPTIRVTRVELTAPQSESLRCKNDVYIPGVSRPKQQVQTTTLVAPAIPGIRGPRPFTSPVAQPVQPNLTEELQQQCTNWGVYWRAPDAHGVVLTQEQATELLQSALGVDVELTIAQPEQTSAQDLSDAEIIGIASDLNLYSDHQPGSNQAEYLDPVNFARALQAAGLQTVTPAVNDCPNFGWCKGLCFQCDYFDSESGLTDYPKLIGLPVKPAILKPLTDTHLCVMLQGIDHEIKRLPPGLKKFARAIEAAHNIALPVQPAPYTPLSTEDYSAIRGQLCESHPGVWLHHYGPAVEAEVLKRLDPEYVAAS